MTIERNDVWYWLIQILLVSVLICFITVGFWGCSGEGSGGSKSAEDDRRSNTDPDSDEPASSTPIDCATDTFFGSVAYAQGAWNMD